MGRRRRGRWRRGRWRRSLGLLLFDVLALGYEELLELARVEVTLGDQDFAQAAAVALPLLELGGFHELLARDELVVQGDPPEEEVVLW